MSSFLVYQVLPLTKTPHETVFNVHSHQSLCSARKVASSYAKNPPTPECFTVSLQKSVSSSRTLMSIECASVFFFIPKLYHFGSCESDQLTI